MNILRVLLFSLWPDLMCVLQRHIVVKENFHCGWNFKKPFTINTGNDCTQMPIHDLGPFNFFFKSFVFY